jgi:hypothetical protein
MQATRYPINVGEPTHSKRASFGVEFDNSFIGIKYLNEVVRPYILANLLQYRALIELGRYET